MWGLVLVVLVIRVVNRDVGSNYLVLNMGFNAFSEVFVILQRLKCLFLSVYLSQRLLPLEAPSTGYGSTSGDAGQ